MAERQNPGDRNLVGARIRAIRIQRGKTQRELIECLNTNGLEMSTSILSRIELQLRPVRDYELYLIAKSLEVSVNELYPKLDRKTDK